MTELVLFLSATVSVALLVIQSINNNHGRTWLAMITSVGIGIAQLYVFKLLPDANFTEICAWLAGGPVGNLIAQYIKRHDIAKIKKLHK